MENELSLHELTEVMDESFSANGFSKFPFGPTYKTIQHKSGLRRWCWHSSWRVLDPWFLMFVIYMCDKNWNSVRRPWCAHTKSPIFPLEVELQMLHICAVRWKQKVRYFLCMHLHICFKLKYLFSQCIGTNIPEHNTKLFMNLSCTTFESNRHLQRFRRATEHRNKCTCHTKITKKASKCYQITSQNTYEHVICVWSPALVHTHRAQALHLNVSNMKLVFITSAAANVTSVKLSEPFHSACVLEDSVCSSSHSLVFKKRSNADN